MLTSTPRTPSSDASRPPSETPRGLETTLPRAVFRSSPNDFEVEEIPAYAASGHGEHLFVTFRKTGLTTENAVRAIAQVLDVDARGAGFAGMKDRIAVTTQTASFPVPIARDDKVAALATAKLLGIEIISSARHDNKLKPGHLIGNRFRIVLRQIADESSAEMIMEHLRGIGRIGVPNAFGPQRFGRDGDNPTRFLTWLRSGGPRSRDRRSGPRNKREQRLLFSALQSLLFNRVLEQRERDDTWNEVLAGDLAKKHDSGGLFLVPLDGPELDDARARALEGFVSATGPMFGSKMRWPEAAPQEIELQTLRAVLDDSSFPGGGVTGASIVGPEEASAQFEPLRHLGEGTRRSLRLLVSDLTVKTIETAPEEGTSSRALEVCFVLPKGGYATTVLVRACQLVELGPDSRGVDSLAGNHPSHAAALLDNDGNGNIDGSTDDNTDTNVHEHE